MKNIHEFEEFYVAASPEGNWFGSNTGPFKTFKWAQKEAKRWSSANKKYRVVKMIPVFFDLETGERITPLPEGLM